MVVIAGVECAQITPLPTDGFVTTVGNPELGARYGNGKTGNHAATMAAASSASGGAGGTGGGEGPSAEGTAIVEGLEKLVAEMNAAPSLKAMEKRKLKEGQESVAALRAAMEAAPLSSFVIERAGALVEAVAAADYAAALEHHAALATYEWATHKSWLKGLKHLLQLAAAVHSR